MYRYNIVSTYKKFFLSKRVLYETWKLCLNEASSRMSMNILIDWLPGSVPPIQLRRQLKACPGFQIQSGKYGSLCILIPV